MMMCNSSAATIIYSILQLISAGYGLQNDYLTNQPACTFRAYCYVTVCTAVATSYATQSISRLFFAVLYKHRSLLTCRVHYYLIIGNYLMVLLGPLAPFIIENGHEFEIESRLCLVSTKVLSASLLSVIITYVIPLTIIIIVHSIVLYKVRQSTRRVVAFNNQATPISTTTASNMPNLKREMKLMRNIVILVGLVVCGGFPYLILMFWHAIQSQSVPESFYLLSLLLITIFIAIKMVVVFWMNTDVRNIVIRYLRKH